MQRSTTRKIVVAALGAAALLGVATAAEARTDVSFSIGLPLPVYAAPAPVYVQPRPIYVQPRPVFAPPPVYVYERGWQPSYRVYDRRYEWREHDQWRDHDGRGHGRDHRQHHWEGRDGRWN